MKILIGCPVRQDEKIFQYYLKSLKRLKTTHHIDYYFILHNSSNLKKYLKPNQYEEFNSKSTYIKNDSHEWKQDNLKEVVYMKNRLLLKAVKENYDYFFLVDSDLILQPETLEHLINQGKEIIAEIFWTEWNSGTEEMPNAWQYDFYGFGKANEWKEWKKAGVYEVGYSGACILISTKCIYNGCNYTPIDNVSFTNWEDRAFCIRAKVKGYKIFLDTNYPATHLYRKQEVLKYELQNNV